MSVRWLWFAGIIIGLNCLIGLLSPSLVRAQAVSQVDLDKLVAQLLANDFKLGNNAAYTIGRLGKDAAPIVPKLVEIIKGDNSSGRTYAASALGQLGTVAAPAVPELIPLLRNRDTGVSRAASSALGDLGAVAASAAIPLAESLRDSNQNTSADFSDALRQLGTNAAPAVPLLIEMLKNKNDLICSEAARVLGGLGSAATSAAIPLAEALADKEFLTKQSAADALAKMGAAASPALPKLISYFDGSSAYDAFAFQPALEGITTDITNNASQIPDDLLVTSLNSLDEAEKRLTSLKDDTRLIQGTVSKAKGEIKGAHAALLVEYRRRFWNRIPEWIRANLWSQFALAWLTWAVVVWLSLYVVSPLWVLWANDKLSFLKNLPLPEWLKWVKESPQYIFAVGLFQFHDKVLDAWVSKYETTAREKLLSLDTFDARRVYVGVPVAFPDADKAPEPADFHKRFERKSAAVLLRGDGGSGKTTLACKMGFWSLGDREHERLCKTHRMMPVFLEANLPGAKAGESAALLRQIGVQLQGLSGEDAAPPDDLIKNLLRKRRIVLIMDGLSERDEATRQVILSGDSALPINALIVTSRHDEKFSAATPVTITVGKLRGKGIADFVEEYIAQSGKRGLFPEPQFYDELQRFTTLVGNREITALLAGLYARYMMEAAENVQTPRPHNIPELMDFYVAKMCSKGDNPAYTEYVVQRLARKIAWNCLQASMTPGETPFAAVITALSDASDGVELPDGVKEAGTVLNYFIDKLHLLERRGSANENLKFAIDPVSEHLAARYLVAHGPTSDAAKWKAFLTNAEAKNGPENAAAGFIRALADTCAAKGAEGPIPPSLVSDLYTRFASILSPHTVQQGGQTSIGRSPVNSGANRGKRRSGR